VHSIWQFAIAGAVLAYLCVAIVRARRSARLRRARAARMEADARDVLDRRSADD
jgi:uncharacterized membrane protein